MSKTKVKLNRSAVGQLLKSEEMASVLKEQADAIATRCGTGYASDVYRGKTRANASVTPSTREAYRDNMENNTILKSIK